MRDTIRVAGVQMDLKLAETEQNLIKVYDAMQSASREGADLAVFPECALTGYCFSDLDEARASARPVPGPFTERIERQCRELDIHVIVGLLEADGSSIYNTAVLIAPNGLIGHYRKIHLPFLGIDRFLSPGDRPFRVYDSEVGRIGLNICYDAAFPESARVMMLRDAELIALPTNWPVGADCNTEFVVNTRAFENRVNYVAVNARKKLLNCPVLDRPAEFFVAEVGWIAQHGVENAEQYRSQRRIGRAAAPLQRRDRDAVFKVYRRYKKLRKEAAKDYDWDDLSHAVLHELEHDSRVRRYRHIVIDEGQDLSPMEIKSLCAAVPQNGSVTFFGDVAQQIYGNKMSWRHAGLQIRGRGVWKFEQNYRNTAQIARLALAVAAMPCFLKDADIVAPKFPTAHGSLPALRRFRTEKEEMQFVARLASSQSRTRSVAVLFRDRLQEREFSSIISARATRLHGELSIWPRSPGLFHGTYHSAKGVEFDTVILPRLSQSRLPDPTTTAAFGSDVAEAKDVSLIYVAVTRAKASLILTYAGEPTSLLPRDKSLYNRDTR